MKDDWDPAVGMTEEQRSGRTNRKDILFAVGTILLIVLGLPTGIYFLMVSGKSDKDPETAALEGLITNLKTKIVEREDCEPGVKGYYKYEKVPGKRTVDEVVICKNAFMFNDPSPDQYWSVLAHESTHIMQACLGTNLYGSYQIKDMSYELLDKDEVSYRTIHGAYVQREEDYEIEARWMALQPKRFVIDELRKHCMERPQDRRF